MFKGALLHTGYLFGLLFISEDGNVMVSQKGRLPVNGLQGVISHKTELSIANAV
jgi:hypothetical protein